MSVIVDKSKSKFKLKNIFSLSGFLNAILTFYEFVTLGPIPVREIEVFKVSSLADQKILNVYNSICPHLVIVYGGKVIPKVTLDGFSSPIINIHGSVLPGYRGLDSFWWAKLENNSNLIGYSIHYVEQGIDTGNILIVRKYLPGDRCFTKNLTWRIWFAQNSAADIINLINENVYSNPGIPHFTKESVYRSTLSFRNLRKVRKSLREIR